MHLSPPTAGSESSLTPRRSRIAPAALTVLILLVMILALRLEGRRWWCACGEWSLWKSDVWSSHCSQHLADPYTFTHFSHGLIFCGAIDLWTRRACRRGRSDATAGRPPAVGWSLCVVVALAAAWEVAENSAYVIERYRSVTMSLEYLGDSITNSVGDVLACIAGYFTARRLGWLKAAALFVAIEIALLILIRDNLTLNVLMLVWPVEGVKAWQTAGHVGPV